MSEVTSVNGMTGAVVLTASNVEAVPTSEVGKAGGVASLNSGGEIPTSQLPRAAVTSGGASNQDLFIATGSGTYTRLSVGERGQQVTVRSDGTVGWITPTAISAKAWGAKGEGGDDTEALKNAMKAATENSVPLVLQAGTYRTTGLEETFASEMLR